MRIVCDTNIWYGLGKGEIDPSIADSHELIITKLSLEEIATSENLISNILMVKKTFKVINKLAKGIIKENPFDYILKSYSHNYIPDNSHTDFIIEKIHQFVQVEDKILLAHSLSEDFRKSIINYDAELHYPTDKLNSLIPEIKANIKKATGKNKHRELDTEELIVELVKKIIEIAIQTYNLKIDINWQSFQWDKYRLLIRAWDIYFKDLELSGRAKLQKNDWVDLLNLTYVMPDMKYWTLEKKWRKIFDRDRVLMDFKFN